MSIYHANPAQKQDMRGFHGHQGTTGEQSAGWRLGGSTQVCLAVAVVPLRQPRRVQRRNGSHGPFGLREAFAPLDAALLVAARRVLPR